MQSDEIRSRFLKFFENRGHKIIPSASLVPLNDPTTLFTGSGMQPMVPYLLGQPHPLGTRIADSQKSFRAVDIEEVGDNRHTTFFEMLGNWSFGDYFKKEQIEWMFEFLINEIGIDPSKLYITTFIGDEKNNIPKDTEAGKIWKKLFTEKGIDAKEVEIGSEENGYKIGMQNGRIFYYDVRKNWWSRAGIPDNMPSGEPGGPDSEMFYEFTEIEHNKEFGENCHPNCDCGRFLEIGNNVFMEYKKNEDGTFSKLPQQNIDFGGGLERIAMAVNNSPDIIKTNHGQILDYLQKLSGKIYGENKEETKSFRIIADHLKASVFLIADGVNPSNTDRGYFVRRLLRRAILCADKLGINNGLAEITDSVLESYKNIYSDTYNKKEIIKKEIEREEGKFRQTLKNGLKEFNKTIGPILVGWEDQKFKKTKNPFIPGFVAFKLFTTHGFPIELIMEIAKEKGLEVDMNGFEQELKEHQKLSQTASAGMFKGGLANHNEKTIKLHTAHHLLLAALQNVVDKNIKQRGSNITEERLRMDFLCDHKLTEEEKKKVEDWVNDKIKKGLNVVRKEMPFAEAQKLGAQMEFGAKYPETVSIYFIEDEKGNPISKEFCGGPHVKNTAELYFSSRENSRDNGPFKIIKEEAVAQGVRRIKATLV
jgi:alanyl-tRNA synthetase